jgi:hypothetical protein
MTLPYYRRHPQRLCDQEDCYGFAVCTMHNGTVGDFALCAEHAKGAGSDRRADIQSDDPSRENYVRPL